MTDHIQPDVYVIDKVTIVITKRDLLTLFDNTFQNKAELTPSRTDARVEMHQMFRDFDENDKSVIIQYAQQHGYKYFFILHMKQRNPVVYNADAWEKHGGSGQSIADEDLLDTLQGSDGQSYGPYDAWSSKGALFFL